MCSVLSQYSFVSGLPLPSALKCFENGVFSANLKTVCNKSDYIELYLEHGLWLLSVSGPRFHVVHGTVKYIGSQRTCHFH